MKPPQLILRLLIIIVVIPVAMVGLWFAMSQTLFKPRIRESSDENLRRVFSDHLDTFESIKNSMMAQERLVGIGNDFFSYLDTTDSRRCQSFWLTGGSYEGNREGSFSLDELLAASGLKREEYDCYMKMLEQIGAYRRIWFAPSRNRDPLKIQMFRSGIVTSGRTKDIVCFDQRFFPDGIPSHFTVVENTDALDKEATWYAPLKDGWYIKHTID